MFVAGIADKNELQSTIVLWSERLKYRNRTSCTFNLRGPSLGNYIFIIHFREKLDKQNM